MAMIELDRRFVEWSEGSRSDAEVARWMGESRGSLGWPELLSLKRVVVLAEGGSGKSSEFVEQNRILAAAGKFSFYLTVKKAGQNGIEDSLTKSQRLRFEDWRVSDQPAWFFIDSIDEAKSNGVGLVEALEHIAAAIEGAELRAHVLISGRHADWEFRKDLESLTSLIPIPRTPQILGKLDRNELVVKTVRREKQKDKVIEEVALVALLAPLEKNQVEKYANAKGIHDAHSFFIGLDKAKLWGFARRPLDLEWLVRYWKKNGTFANFEKMLEVNLTERLRETDPGRAKALRFDQIGAMQALERLGAALVFEKLVDIEIPDSGNLDNALSALRLTEIWQDMPQDQQAQIINSPVFVPSGVGMVRLHNDNEGVVRSYLAAKWLKRMLDTNCPWSTVANLLFSTTYEFNLIKPSMRLTAAWLALRDDRVAQEIIAREPILLMEAGDPASLSLPIRKRALTAVVAAMAENHADRELNHDGLRRFAWKDMEPTIRELWALHSGTAAVRHLLLQMIELSELSGLADIAADAAMDVANDEITLSLAVQALAAVAIDETKAKYVEFVLAHAANMPASVVWSAINEFFPASMSVANLLQLFPTLLPTMLGDESGGRSDLEFYGPKIAEKLEVANDATRLLAFFLEKIPKTSDDISREIFDSMAPLLPTMLALSQRILDLTGDATPPNLVIDMSFRLTHYTAMHGWHRRGATDLAQRLRDTPRRRRAALWRLSETFADFEPTQPALSEPWQLRLARFDPGIQSSDMLWLLSDAVVRDKEAERALAMGLIMEQWLRKERSESLLGRAKAAAGKIAALVTVIDSWLNPPPPSPAMLKMDANEKKYQEAQDKRQKIQDDSWTNFADEIRQNPAQLTHLRAPDAEGVDARIFHIWELFTGLADSSSRRSLPDVGLLTPLFGADVVPFIGNAFIRYWRLGKPILRNERPVGEHNMDNAMDALGLVGIAVEAASDPKWISKLTDAEAMKAAAYATLELNAFPDWFTNLCEAKPAICLDVLRRTISSEISPESSENREALQRIARSDDSIVSLVAPEIFLLVESSTELPLQLLLPALKIARRGLTDQAALLALMLSRTMASTAPSYIDAYLACAFTIDGNVAAKTLFEVEQTLTAADTSALASTLLPKIMGHTFGLEDHGTPELSASNLALLIVFAFDRIRPADDLDRANGRVYSPNERDHAQSARDRAITNLASIPGAPTIRALDKLMALPHPPIPSHRLAQIILRRAQADSESAPWSSTEVTQFESDFATVPKTPIDLQRVAAQRIEDLQHRLMNADFGQGAVVARLPHEVDVQRWMADALEQRQGRSFSLEREPHVMEEKEPDLRLTAKGSDARMPIEIKVAESWTLKQLEEALTVQLQGRYLRDREARWGILLIVHQTARPLGWANANADGFLSFSQVIQHLQALAKKISADDSLGPQLQVCAIDVSTVKR